MKLIGLFLLLPAVVNMARISQHIAVKTLHNISNALHAQASSETRHRRRPADESQSKEGVPSHRRRKSKLETHHANTAKSKSRVSSNRRRNAHSQQRTKISLPYKRVDAVFTFGAPSAGGFWNEGSDNGCFPGIRFYTEDTPQWGRLHQVDFAANFAWEAAGIQHARTNVVALHWHDESYFRPCADDPKPTWPDGGYPTWEFHSLQEHYDPRLRKTKYWEAAEERSFDHYNGDEYVEQFTIGGAGAEAALAQSQVVYWDGDIKEAVWQVEQKKEWPKWPDSNWRLVFKGYVQGHHSDKDWLMLTQDSQTMNCMLAFSGTNAIESGELFTSMDLGTRSYCGLDHVHNGFVGELEFISKTAVYDRLKKKLARCDNLTVTGHSLGGALAELFAACINKAVDGNLRWQQEERKVLRSCHSGELQHLDGGMMHCRDEPDLAQPSLRKLVDADARRCKGAPAGGSWNNYGKNMTVNNCEQICADDAKCKFVAYSNSEQGCSKFDACDLASDTSQKWTIFAKVPLSRQVSLAVELPPHASTRSISQVKQVKRSRRRSRKTKRNVPSH